MDCHNGSRTADITFLLQKYFQENEKSRDIIIEHRFHRTIIGAKGEKIKEVRDKYPDVQVSFPDPGRKSDIVTLRGPKGDVDKVYAYMNKLNAELVRIFCLYSIVLKAVVL